MTLAMNAGQKSTLSITNMVDGAGNPVSAIPAGAKIAYVANTGYITVAANPDGVTAVVEALTPPSQGYAAQAAATMTYTDSAGIAHSVYATLNITVDFAPGVPLTFAIGASTPA